MNQKQLLIFVATLFSVIAIMAIISVNRESKIYNKILKASPEQITNVHFFKDFIRDDSGLNAPVTDSADLAEFQEIIKNIGTWGGSIKELDCSVSYKIRFILKDKKDHLLTIDIFDTGDNGILSISQGENLITSVGNYQSYELLQWIKKMEQKDDFKDIKCLY